MKLLPIIITTLAAVTSTATATNVAPRNLRGRYLSSVSSESEPSAPSEDSEPSVPSDPSVSSED